jgi:hypothetical protein
MINDVSVYPGANDIFMALDIEFYGPFLQGRKTSPSAKKSTAFVRKRFVYFWMKVVFDIIL